MKYDKTKWIECVKKVVAELKTKKPTQSKVCAIATARYIRDGLLDDLFSTKPGEKRTKEDEEQVVAIRESFKELITQLNTDGAEAGFASNTSAASKAAGFDTRGENEIAELKD